MASTAVPNNGGFVWNVHRNRTILLVGLGRNISTADIEAIAESFTVGERPTLRQVWERFSELRTEQIAKLKETGIIEAVDGEE